MDAIMMQDQPAQHAEIRADGALGQRALDGGEPLVALDEQVEQWEQWGQWGQRPFN